MSAEGKKKRGEAGKSNAETIPFRYGNNGWRPPFDPHKTHARRVNRETLFGFFGGLIVSRLGYPFNPGRLIVEAINNGTVEAECPTISTTINNVFAR